MCKSFKTPHSVLSRPVHPGLDLISGENTWDSLGIKLVLLLNPSLTARHEEDLCTKGNLLSMELFSM